MAHLANARGYNGLFDEPAKIYRMPTRISSLNVDQNDTRIKAISKVKTKSKARSLMSLSLLVSLLTSFLSTGQIQPAAETNPEPVVNLSTTFNSSKSKCGYGFVGKYCDPCGVTYYNPNTKIVGGQEAVPHSWPAEALIFFNYTNNVYVDNINRTITLSQQFLCGGTLINRDTVMSAGHCVMKKLDFDFMGDYYSVDVKPNANYPTEGSYYTIYLGIHDMMAAINNKFTSGIKVGVKSVITHPKFNMDTLQNDISIFKLNQEVKLDKNVQLACLPDQSNYPKINNQDLWAMGWGTTSEGGNISPVLRNIKMKLLNPNDCSKVYPEIPKNWNNQLCAGSLLGGQDTCQGDSGGGVYIKDYVNNGNKMVAVGVVSYGDGCARVGLPGIYTKVSSYVDWINSVAF